MWMFETLLLKELQKQQSRAEFCDIVLQTQGVSVPVHSCVLSAFSPLLSGILSTMPSLQSGQRRLIKVQLEEACTLLSLVSLLYSGQFAEDHEKVLSAARKLGICIPRPDPARPGTERACQTDALECSPPESGATITAIPDNQRDPENSLPVQVLDPHLYPNTSFPQVYIYPPACPIYPPAQPSPDLPKPGAGEDGAMDALAHFEDDIPGFINHFFGAQASQRRGQETKTEDRVRERSRVRGAAAQKWTRMKVNKTEANLNRFGRVLCLSRTGQGGGRVGRVLDSRLDFKKMESLKRRRQGRAAMGEEEKRGKARNPSRNRVRTRQTDGRRPVQPPAQEAELLVKRGRGRSRLHHSPLPYVSRASLREASAVKPPAPFLMHTSALPPPPLCQPIDRLIDDVIAAMPFTSTNQHGSTGTQSRSAAKLTDQPEGELTDMLDSFLRTFDLAESGVLDTTEPNNTPSIPRSICTRPVATPVSLCSRGVRRRPASTALRSQKPACYRQLACVKVETPRGDGASRVTRSQTRKRRCEEEQPEEQKLPCDVNNESDEALKKKKKKKKKKEKRRAAGLQKSLKASGGTASCPRRNISDVHVVCNNGVMKNFRPEQHQTPARHSPDDEDEDVEVEDSSPSPLPRPAPVPVETSPSTEEEEEDGIIVID